MMSHEELYTETQRINHNRLGGNDSIQSCLLERYLSVVALRNEVKK